MTPLERLESVRNEAGLSQSAFSLRCGWPRGQYATIAGRLRKGETDNLQRETAEAIEAAFGVRKEWLMFETGGRHVVADGVVEGGRYPEREEELALYPNLDPEIRRLVSGMQLHRGVRPSRAIWRGMIEGMLAAKARGEDLTAPSVESEQEVPPVRRGRK